MYKVKEISDTKSDKMVKFWSSLEQQLRLGRPVILLYVLHSEGSSPGRQGFKMQVGVNHWMMGSIGGGAMEFKLVELARSLIGKGRFSPFAKKQIHRSNEAYDRSGMICSGQQVACFYYLDQSDLDWIAKVNIAIVSQERPVLRFSHQGVELAAGNWEEAKMVSNQQYDLQVLKETEWSLLEQIGYKPYIYIIGAGHVSLALSSLMQQLGFYVKLLDDRQQLNTMLHNDTADEKINVDYEKIAEQITESNPYVALMSFGYRTDKQIIRRLLGKEMAYFGVLGSKAKMEKLLLELKEEGLDEKWLNSISTPIGLPIKSRTPMEIAVSIAAEIIAIKNRD